MLKFQLFLIKCILAGAVLTGELRAAATCEMSLESLKQRDRYLTAQTQLADKQLASSNEALKKIESSIKGASHVKLLGAIINGVVSIATKIVPGLAVVKNLATEIGLPFIGKILKAKPPATDVDASPGLIVLIEGKKIYARDPAEALTWITTRMDELERLKEVKGNQLVDQKIAFLSATCQGDGSCPIDSTELDELFASLAKWFQKANAAQASSDKQTQLREVQLPFVQTTIRWLKIKQSYLRQLKDELKQRAATQCGLAA